MPDTIPTADALLAAIHSHPEEDTPRLVYADWLDETEEPEQMERAELIRVQCGPHQCAAHGHCRTGHCREKILFEKHPEWLRVMCPACGGKKRRSENPDMEPSIPCPFCSGTGHLPLVYRRGFPFRVTVPRLEQVGEERDGMICRRCNYWAPVDDVASRCDVCRKAYHPYDDAEIRFRSTDHARNLMAALPTVQELVPGDRKPESGWRTYGELAVDGSQCVWHCNASPAHSSHDHYGLPQLIWESLKGYDAADTFWKRYSTDSDAISALGVTLAAIVRGATC